MQPIFGKHNKVLFNLAFFIVILFSASIIITACSGYGSDYNPEKEYEDLFDEYFSSSSYSKYSSSSEKYSSSSSARYSSSEFEVILPSSSSYFDTTNTVKTVDDLDSCTDGEKKTVLTDTSLYRCAFGVWFKELKSVPECTKKNENETFYKNAAYVCINENWRELTAIEAKLGVCTKSLSGKTKVTDNKTYKCDTSLVWRSLTLAEATGECTTANNGKTTSYGDTSYICRGTSWQKMTQIELDSGVCNKERQGELLRVKPLYSYRDTTYYKCNNYEWKSTIAAEDIIGKCDSTKTADSIYRVASTNYVCDNGTWRAPTTMETSYGFCNAKNQDSIKKSGSTKYICDKGTWRITNAEEYYGACTDSLEDITYSYDSKLYACINKKWTVLPEPPVSSLSYCTKKNQGTKTKTTSPKAYYICDNYQWQKIDSLSYTIGICNKDSVGVRKSNYECRDKSGTYSWVKLTIAEQLGAECTALNDGDLNQGYVCDSTKWRLQTTREKNIGETCTNSKIGEKVDYAGESYTCQARGWVSFSEEMSSMGACTDEGRILQNDTITKVCYLEKWVRPANMYIDTTKDCGRDNVGKIGLFNGMLYQCTWSLDRWLPAGPIGMEVGYVCTDKNTGKIVLAKDSIYYACRKQGEYKLYWSAVELDEILTTCTVGNVKDVLGQKYSCTAKNKWTPVYGSVKDSEGKSYKTFKVGKQLWMAENLNTATSGSSCYNSAQDNCAKYGRLYNWSDISTACPDGWHVPSVADFWTYLRHPLSPSVTSDTLWQDDITIPYYSKAKISGLEILPAGMKNASGSYEYINRVGGLWFSDEDGGYGYAEAYGNTNNQSWTRDTPTEEFTSIGLGSSHPTAYRISKSYAFPIRCVKDLK